MKVTALILADGHYLNLPVMSEQGEIVGMVDVLKLTYATLDQINSMSTGEGEGPAWQKFWLSMGEDTESQMSGGAGGAPRTPITRSAVSPGPVRPDLERGDSVMPHESASHHGDDLEDRSAVAGMSPGEDAPFAFKFKAPSGRVHRLQVTAAAGMEEFVNNVTAKLGNELDAVGGEPAVVDGRMGRSGFALSYMDNEGDTVSITTDQDLLEAITIARNNKRDKVDLFVHDPEKPPLPSTVTPQPGLPDTDALKQRRKKLVEDELGSEDEDETLARHHRRGQRQQQHQQQEQVIQGVPNELLLPGAIAALAVVIVGVFAVSRSGSR